MSFGDHYSVVMRMLRGRKHKPNMRIAWDYKSRKGVKIKSGKTTKKMTAQEIAQLRYYLDETKRNKRKYQLLALVISLVALAVLLFLFLELVAFLQNQPDELF